MYEKKYYNTPKVSMPFTHGIHPVLEALHSGKEIEKILIRRGLKNEAVTEIFKICKERNIPVQEVPEEKLNRVTLKPHQGIIAFLGLVEYQNIENIVPFLFEQGKTPLLVILDRVTDVRNVGAICRSALCAGAGAVIVPSRGAAQMNEDAIKSSAGAIHQIPICRSYNLKETIQFLKDSGIKIVGVTEKSKNMMYQVNFTEPTCIIMGSEEDGISPEYLKLCDDTCKIPIQGPVESLNVSVATAVALFEVVRQRN
jgi:23S rRNA (guanosine2251-2'-O)-methyltransferase